MHALYNLELCGIDISYRHTVQLVNVDAAGQPCAKENVSFATLRFVQKCDFLDYAIALL